MPTSKFFTSGQRRTPIRPDLRVVYGKAYTGVRRVINTESGGEEVSRPATPKDIFDWLLGCETCGGSGKEIVYDQDDKADGWHKCPDCEGRCRRISDKVVEAAGARLFYLDQDDDPWYAMGHFQHGAKAVIWAAVEAWEADNA